MTIDVGLPVELGPPHISFSKACGRLGIEICELAELIEWFGFTVLMPMDSTEHVSGYADRTETGWYSTSPQDVITLAFGASDEIRQSGFSKKTGSDVTLVSLRKNLRHAVLSLEQFAEIERIASEQRNAQSGGEAFKESTPLNRKLSKAGKKAATEPDPAKIAKKQFTKSILIGAAALMKGNPNLIGADAIRQHLKLDPKTKLTDEANTAYKLLTEFIKNPDSSA